MYRAAPLPVLIPLILAACQPGGPGADNRSGSDGGGAPPNVIVVVVDDLRWDEYGAAGHPYLETPNIDRLAREGARFINAFHAVPLCSPNRASILTGQMMHNHGVIDNNRPLPGGLELFPARLRDAGYQTAFVGKWHMGGAISAPRSEFDFWVSFPGQGTYYPTNAFGQTTMLNVNGEAVAQRGYITDELTEYVFDFLRERDPDRPFFVYLSHKAVHATFEPAPRHADPRSPPRTMKDPTRTRESRPSQPM